MSIIGLSRYAEIKMNCNYYSHTTVFPPVQERNPLAVPLYKKLSIFYGCLVWIEKSVSRVTDRHHEACRVMPISDPE